MYKLLITLLMVPLIIFGQEEGEESPNQLKEIRSEFEKIENIKIKEFKNSNNKEFNLIYTEIEQDSKVLNAYIKEKIKDSEKMKKPEYKKALNNLRKSDPQVKKQEDKIGGKRTVLRKWMAANDSSFNEIFQKRLAIDKPFALAVSKAK